MPRVTPEIEELVREWVFAMNAEREAYREIQANPCEESSGPSGDVYVGDHDPDVAPCWVSRDLGRITEDELCPGCAKQREVRLHTAGLHKTMIKARRRLLYYGRKMIQRSE